MQNNLLSQKEIEILDLVASDKTYQDYFFSNVDDPRWLIPLRSRDLINPDDELAPEVSDDGRLISYPRWRVLPYLLKITGRLTSGGENSQLEILITLIQAVHANRRGNATTLWYFVQILAKLPVEQVPVHIYALVTDWVQQDMRSYLLGSELVQELLPAVLHSHQSKEQQQKLEFVLDALTLLVLKPRSEGGKGAFGNECDYFLAVEPYWIDKAIDRNIDQISGQTGNWILSSLCRKIELCLASESAEITFKNGPSMFTLHLRTDMKHYFLAANFETKCDEAAVIPFSGRCDEFIELGSEWVSGLITLEDNAIRDRLRQLWFCYHGKDCFTALKCRTRRHAEDPVETLLRFAEELLTARFNQSPADASLVIAELFRRNFLIFRKLALHLLGQFESADLASFWSAIGNADGDILFEGLFFGEELRVVLNRIADPTASQIEVLKARIASGSAFSRSDDAESDLIWKQARYEALSHLPVFKALHLEIKEKTLCDFTLHPAVSFGETRWGYGSSPIQVDEFKNLNSAELAAFLAEFKTVDSWNGPTVWALGEHLRDFVKKYPHHIVPHLNALKSTAYLYVSRILEGMRECFCELEKDDKGRVLLFLERYIDRDIFWTDQLEVLNEEVWSPGHEWVLSDFAALVDTLCRAKASESDDWLCDGLERLISRCLAKIEPSSTSERSDPVFNAINSTVGKLCEAALNLSLRRARLHPQTNPRWSSVIRDKVDDLLDRNIIDVWTIVGMYIPSLFYLDESWMRSRILAFSNLSSELWQSCMYGYLNSSRFYDPVYIAMCAQYERALETPESFEGVSDRLVEHYALAYLRGLETVGIEGSFDRWLDVASGTQLRHLVWFVWSLHNQDDAELAQEKLPEPVRQRIIKLWRTLFNRLTAESTDVGDRQTALGALGKLGVYLQSIDDETKSWLEMAASRAHLDHETVYLLEALEHLSKLAVDAESAKRIGSVMLRLLAESTPDFRKEDVRDIVEYLYRFPETASVAADICNTYGRRGSHFLKDIYEKHSKRILI